VPIAIAIADRDIPESAIATVPLWPALIVGVISGYLYARSGGVRVFVVHEFASMVGASCQAVMPAQGQWLSVTSELFSPSDEKVTVPLTPWMVGRVDRDGDRASPVSPRAQLSGATVAPAGVTIRFSADR
jgi:hypothetical protein